MEAVKQIPVRREYHRQYHLENRDKKRAYHRSWRQRRMRRAIDRGANGRYCYGWQVTGDPFCHICGKLMLVYTTTGLIQYRRCETCNVHGKTLK